MNNQPTFYYLPQKIVNFQELQEVFIVYPSQIKEDLTPEGVINALKYKFQLNYFGKQYQKIMVPCIPANEHKIQGEPHLMKNQLFLLLIKTNQQTKLKGYASGKRSAIFIKQGKFYRYKGCGNLLQGFVLQNNQLRGSHFFSTVKRQLYMTNKINEILSKELNIKSANKPLGMYRIGSQIKKFGLSNQLQLLQKYCAVFQTIGDRRVGTHLISPLEILFLNICDVQQINWFQIFQKNNRIDEGQPIQFLSNFQLFLDSGEKFLKKFDSSNSEFNYINLQNMKIQNVKNIQQITDKICSNLLKNQQSKKYISQILKENINWKDTILVILQKIGYQMGEIKRIFCQHQLNWGFYSDHPGVWHCNAHLNNFVVTYPEKNQQYAIPLDFDLAFCKHEFVHLQYQSENYGKFDQDIFEQFLCSQFTSMQMSVSGMQLMNFKYTIGNDNAQELPKLSPIKMARIAFRDCLVKSFRSGMRRTTQQKERINQNWNKSIQSIRKVVKMSLLMSQNFQT